ncbi:DUF3822 family protein [Mucilaginibacter sp.]|uniref:DUF3822 family protein n=1 Tax=Mucilaginibacter sp. TaxID=1882438 RepID=UPI002611E85C|nr:DUF3822 family protein [Mucilaginibacter sp.]MDB4924908.1 hypothetical protein [Mucilaginibacter sp.]
MTEQIYTYRDPSFNLNQAYYYTLLMQIDAVSFSYAITYNRQLIAWGTNCSLTELSDPQELAEELSATYKKVVIGLPANGFSLLPSHLFNKAQIPNYARLLDVKPDERVLAQVLDDQNFIIYKVDEKIISAVQRFDLDNTVYLNKGWITSVTKNSPQNQDLYLHTENGKAEFLYFKDGKIRLYNNFDFTTGDDLAYYAAFITEELNLDAHDIHFKLSGNIKPGDKYSTRLADFFPDIVFYDPQILELPEQIPSQQILTLAALSLCGSLEVL